MRFQELLDYYMQASGLLWSGAGGGIGTFLQAIISRYRSAADCPAAAVILWIDWRTDWRKLPRNVEKH